VDFVSDPYPASAAAGVPFTSATRNPVSCVVCRVSCVVCRVSCVVCRVSCVVCRVSCVVCRVVRDWMNSGMGEEWRRVTIPAADAAGVGAAVGHVGEGGKALVVGEGGEVDVVDALVQMRARGLQHHLRQEARVGSSRVSDGDVPTCCRGLGGEGGATGRRSGGTSLLSLPSSI
jgi:hypothetical protein